jgi:hypothetical protein
MISTDKGFTLFILSRRLSRVKICVMIWPHVIIGPLTPGQVHSVRNLFDAHAVQVCQYIVPSLGGIYGQFITE